MIADAVLEYTGRFYRKNEYPALADQMTEWKETRPLAGLRILDSTPLFTNTLLKYVPLLLAGAELTAATNDRIPYDKSLIPLLESWGIPHRHNADSGTYDCILDCGGVHAALRPRYGTGELTRSGFYQYCHADFPVILVDDSRIKAIETCLGTGDGFLRGMQESGYTDFRNKRLVLFGYGKVGRGIAWYSRKAGAEVIVVDVPGTAVPEDIRLISRYDREEVLQAVRTAWCVVTATGVRDAMTGNGAAEEIRKGPQLVAAMGVENEWGSELPPERILNHNQPLNFILPEPTRLRYIDPTMALSNAAVLELCRGNYPAGIRRISPETEKHYRDVTERHGVIAEELQGAGL